LTGAGERLLKNRAGARGRLRREHECVVTGAATQTVVAKPTDKNVIAVSAFRDVVARTAIQQIVAITA